MYIYNHIYCYNRCFAKYTLLNMTVVNVRYLAYFEVNLLSYSLQL